MKAASSVFIVRAQEKDAILAAVLASIAVTVALRVSIVLAMVQENVAGVMEMERLIAPPAKDMLAHAHIVQGQVLIHSIILKHAPDVKVQKNARLVVETGTKPVPDAVEQENARIVVGKVYVLLAAATLSATNAVATDIARNVPAMASAVNVMLLEKQI